MVCFQGKACRVVLMQQQFRAAGIGEDGFRQRSKVGRLVGYCAECGGEVKLLWSSAKAGRRETVCAKCGAVNPRLKKVELDDEEVVRCMKVAYEEISKRLGGQELDGNAWLKVVEYLLGQSIPISMWKCKGQQWIKQAGLEVTVDGKIRREM